MNEQIDKVISEGKDKRAAKSARIKIYQKAIGIIIREC
jgi:hypothetical protein